MLVSDVALHKESREWGRGLVVEFEVRDRKAMRSKEGEDSFESGNIGSAVRDFMGWKCIKPR